MCCSGSGKGAGSGMNFVETALLAAGLSMDAFAVSVCTGLALPAAGPGRMALCGAWFGGFQALMPLIGWALGGLFAGAAQRIAPYAACFLLWLIGINLMRGADQPDAVSGDLSAGAMLPLALATSIDALAAGVSMALTGAAAAASAACIGVTTFCLSAAGVRLGKAFGSRLGSRARIAGGLILLGLGARLLLTKPGGIG